MRGLRLGFTAMIFGPLDEFIASPRLLPLFWSVIPVYKLMGCGVRCGCSCCECCGSYNKLVTANAFFQKTIDPATAPFRVQVELDDNNKPIVKPLPTEMNCFGNCFTQLVRCLCCEEAMMRDGHEVIPNPALDYIGTGGSTFMVVDPKVTCCDACCGNYTRADIRLDTLAGVRQTLGVFTNNIRQPTDGVADHLPNHVHAPDAQHHHGHDGEAGHTGAAAAASTTTAAAPDTQ